MVEAEIFEQAEGEVQAVEASGGLGVAVEVAAAGDGEVQGLGGGEEAVGLVLAVIGVADLDRVEALRLQFLEAGRHIEAGFAEEARRVCPRREAARLANPSQQVIGRGVAALDKRRRLLVEIALEGFARVRHVATLDQHLGKVGTTGLSAGQLLGFFEPHLETQRGTQRGQSPELVRVRLPPPRLPSPWHPPLRLHLPISPKTQFQSQKNKGIIKPT